MGACFWLGFPFELLDMFSRSHTDSVFIFSSLVVIGKSGSYISGGICD